ncbi:PHD-zinc-finger like domain-containing protein, partial [Cantharellus anzutake]|uniref:PHD-zinc-finger like domain-containing protein n=1 Tax=Cantharellus anzutake TaxID=1750568 RepID=UPI001905A126
MAPRASSLTAHQPPPLPKVSFRKVEEDVPTSPIPVFDNQARSFGYNDGEDFVMPDHYIRYIEPIESELARQVEYDMDEQDQEWLIAMNQDRRKEQVDQVSNETFEIIMDRLEKEWFELMKKVPKQETALPSEDSTCAVCDDGEGENSNAIVFCDGCNLAVHQDCYGVPYIPEGQWLCRKCTVAPEMPVSCILCPNEGGAFKQTTEGKWAHLLCAIWVPEITVGNQVFMEPIDNVKKIPKSRWKLHCSLCSYRMGACIQCDNRTCFAAFHVTCARQHGLLAPMKTLPDPDNHDVAPQETPLRAFCEKHLTPEMRTAREALSLDEDGNPRSSPKSTKSAKAYARSYRSGPPLVPAIVVNNIMKYIDKISLRKKLIFVTAVCRYWSLKREARRGAPLLKRLHLEPWTASSVNKSQTEEAKLIRLNFLTRIRSDLEKVRTMAEFARKREKEKTRQAQLITSFLEKALFPFDDALLSIFDQVQSLDRFHVFANPVTQADAPDYHTIVKRPMSWQQMRNKLLQHEYNSVQDFKDDVHLILDNSLLYNRPDHQYHKLAARMKTQMVPILEKLQPPGLSSGMLDDSSQRGDLEPPIETLRILTTLGSIDDHTNMMLTADPITSLFSQELLNVKPPPPKAAKPSKPRARERFRKQAAGEVTAEGVGVFRAPPIRLTRSVHAAEQSLLAPYALSPSGAGGEEHQSSGESSQRSGRTTPRTRSARALAAALESNANEVPPEIAAAAEREAAEEAAAAAKRAAEEALVLRRQKQREYREDRKKRKREEEEKEGVMNPGMPAYVEEVNNKQSFAMFNWGWVLPPGSRRGNRPAPERPSVPYHNDRKKSRLATEASAPHENLTLEQPPTSGTAPSTMDTDLGPSSPPNYSVEVLTSTATLPHGQPASGQETPSPPPEASWSELSELSDEEAAHGAMASGNSMREATPLVPVQVGGHLPGEHWYGRRLVTYYPFWPAVVF